MDTGRVQERARELGERLTGEVLLEGDERYDLVREVWNATIDRRPAVIANCATEADVVLALAFAADNGLPVAIRGGGHSVAGTGTCEGGLMIALRLMTDIEVDPEAREVRVQGGALLGAVDRACQAHDLATPAGVVSHTGVGGLSLGGGVGWLTRKYGLTCDSLLEARVVTPAHGVVTASATSHPDLFWALRGGGGNFGVVTEFTFRCHPVPRVLPVAMAVWALEDAPAALRAYREVMPQQPDEVKGTMFFITADERLQVAPEVIGRKVVALVQPYIGEDVEAAERALAPLTAAVAPLRAEIVPMRWLDLQTLEDDISGFGKGNYTKGGYLDEIGDDLIEAVVEAVRHMPGPECQLEIIPHGGAQLAVAEEDSAFSDRAAPYSFNVFARWAVREDGAAFVGWTRETYAAMQPFIGSGVYTNFFADDDGQDRVLAAYGPEKYARLARVKAVYDPANLLSINQNIRPATEPTVAA